MSQQITNMSWLIVKLHLKHSSVCPQRSIRMKNKHQNFIYGKNKQNNGETYSEVLGS